MAGSLKGLVLPSGARKAIAEDSGSAGDTPEATRSGAPAEAGGAVRLDQRTHLDSGRYRIVLRDYGGGLG